MKRNIRTGIMGTILAVLVLGIYPTPSVRADGSSATVIVGWLKLEFGTGDFASAKSCHLTLYEALLGGGNYELTVNRDLQNINPYQQLIQLIGLKSGRFLLEAKFYDAENATGNFIGSASTYVDIRNPITDPAGCGGCGGSRNGAEPLPGTIATGEPIASLSIVPDQAISVGQTITLKIVALTGTGGAVPVLASAVTVTQQGGTGGISVNGAQITGVTPGPVSISVSVNGLAADGSITVTP